MPFLGGILLLSAFYVITRIGRGSGYKVSELSSMAEGQTLAVGGKEIEVSKVDCCTYLMMNMIIACST